MLIFNGINEIGGVKLNNILPLERDADLEVLSSDFNDLTHYLGQMRPAIGKIKISK